MNSLGYVSLIRDGPFEVAATASWSTLHQQSVPVTSMASAPPTRPPRDLSAMSLHHRHPPTGPTACDLQRVVVRGPAALLYASIHSIGVGRGCTIGSGRTVRVGPEGCSRSFVGVGTDVGSGCGADTAVDCGAVVGAWTIACAGGWVAITMTGLGIAWLRVPSSYPVHINATAKHPIARLIAMRFCD